VLPHANVDAASRGLAPGCELIGVRTVGEALDALIA